MSLVELYLSNPTAFWITVIISFFLTWGLGLLPTLLLKKFIFKIPMPVWQAVLLQLPLWTLNLFIFIALGSESKTHTSLSLVAIVSILILTEKIKLPQLQFLKRLNVNFSPQDLPKQATTVVSKQITAGSNLRTLTKYILLTLLLLFGIFGAAQFIRQMAGGFSLDDEQTTICSFEIIDLQEYHSGGDPTKIAALRQEISDLENSNRFFASSAIYHNERKIWEEENYRWFHYEGVIRNTSNEEQFLMDINAKLRTEDNVFLGEGWTPGIMGIEKWLAPNEGLPFNITIKVDSEDIVKRYILNENISLKTDFYPWFDSCTY